MEKYKKALLLEVWDREFKVIPMNAIKSKDKKMKKYAQDIMMIRKEVKQAVLDNYLWRCSLRHSLAFF